MKKEIVIGQNQSNSLSTLIQYFSNEQYEIRIAPNFDAVVRLESEQQSDFLILSAKLLPMHFSISSHFRANISFRKKTA